MTDLLDIPFDRMDGTVATLRDYPGLKLVVNVASLCHQTVQYETLQALYDEKKHSGLEILAFPGNDFKDMEPGSDEEILNFCQREYSVTFPVFSKMTVTGPDKHPLFEALTTQAPISNGDQECRELVISYGEKPDEFPGLIWNFEKFLINPAGEIVGRFIPTAGADEPELRGAVEAQLDTVKL